MFTSELIPLWNAVSTNADAIQAAMSVIGVIFIFIGFYQANKNLSLQTKALRASTRPVLEIQGEKFWEEKHYSFRIVALNNDAIDIIVKVMHGNGLKYPYSFKKFNKARLLKEKESLPISLIPVNDNSFNKWKRLKHRDFRVKIEFYDEHGYKYLQYAKGTVGSGLYLTRVKFL